MENKEVLAAFGGVILGLLLEKLSSTDPSIHEKLNLIIQNQKKMATSLAQISAKADELQAALDAEQEQIAAAKTELNAKLDAQTALIEELRATIADGGTEEERASVLSKLDSSVVDLKGTVEDLPTGGETGGGETGGGETGEGTEGTV